MSRLGKSIIGRTWDEWRHRGLQAGGDAEDFLLVTWDSCRHDAFEPLPFYNRFVQQLWRISHRNVDVKPPVVFPDGHGAGRVSRSRTSGRPTAPSGMQTCQPRPIRWAIA